MLQEFFTVFGGPWIPLAAFLVAGLAGFIKGVTGVGLPLIFVTGLSLILPIEVVVAMIAVPALVTNVMQASNAGRAAAWATFSEFWLITTILFCMTLLCTQLVVVLERRTLLLLLGIGVFLITSSQTLGPQLWWPERWRKPIEVLYGIVAGFFGGLSGLWGTALISYFMALRMDKESFVRTTGVAWLAGSIPYTIGHLQNGILNATTIPLSIAAVAPAVIGMWLGKKLRHRINLSTFRRITTIVILLSALNLIRRGIWY